MIERFVVPLGTLVPAVFVLITALCKVEPGSALQVALGSLGVALGGYLTLLAEQKPVAK